jgi:hypothetical protein
MLRFLYTIRLDSTVPGASDEVETLVRDLVHALKVSLGLGAKIEVSPAKASGSGDPTQTPTISFDETVRRTQYSDWEEHSKVNSPSSKKDTTTLSDTVDKTGYSRANQSDETEPERELSNVSSLWSIEKGRTGSPLNMIRSRDPKETGRAFNSWKSGSRSFRKRRASRRCVSKISTPAISAADATPTQTVILTADSRTGTSR